MGSLSIWHWLIVLAIVLVLFGGRGKISNIMGDMAKGVKAFKKGLHEEDEPAQSEAQKSIPASGVQPGNSRSAEASVHRDDAARG